MNSFNNENDYTGTEVLTFEDLAELVRKKKYSAYKEAVSELVPYDAAELLANAEGAMLVIMYRLLPKEMAAEVFVEMDTESQVKILETFTDRELSDILSELYLDDTVDMIEEMPANVVKRIVKMSTPENRSDINKLLNYPEDSAGTVMTTEYVRLRGNMSVSDALTHIREVGEDKETVYTCYVTDSARHLVGVITARELLLSSPESKIESLMEDSVMSVNTLCDREEVALIFKRYGFIALPVVDNEERLVGIVTVDDIIDVISEEVEEDFAKMAAIVPVETPYLKTSVMSIFKSRIPWLLILMVSATFSSTILGRFEAALPAVFIIFVPMLMDTGGNSGGQSSVTVIRALSMAQIRLSDVLRVVWKEVRVGALAGLVLGAVSFLKVLLVDRILMNNPAVSYGVAIAVSLTLAVSVITAKLIGSTLPILAKRIGLDPAVMASPLITTLVDVVSLLLYFAVASIFI